MDKKKLAIIGTAGIPSEYGGFETLVEHLTYELNDKMNMTVYCSGKKYNKEGRKKSHNGARLVYLPFHANGFQSIIYDSISILHAVFYADVLLVLGVSAGLLLPLIRLFTGKKIITSIDGLEWKRSKWNKMTRWFLWLSEWCAVKASHANIADNESIQDYTAMRYGSLSNIIEYGADHVMPVKPQEDDYTRYPFLVRTYAIKVCRIEPENNIHIVLDAFAAMDNYNLVVVGNWNASEYGIALREKYSTGKNIIMLDPIYNQRDINMLRSNAVVYVHGHSAGGTNPSLVEAMHLHLPVIAFGVNYNRTTTEGKALYFRTSEDLKKIVSGVRLRELKQTGAAMGAIADRRYKWSVIAGKYLYLVNAVCDNSIAHNLKPSAGRRISASHLADIGISHLQTTALFYEKR